MKHEFAPGLRAKCWGYNGHVNSTVIEAVEGDRVRIYVTNRLPEPPASTGTASSCRTAWTASAGLTQKHIEPGETFKYEFTLRQHGTFMYHPHHDEMTQMGMGMMGLFIIHPRQPAPQYRVDRDFAIMLSEWADRRPAPAGPNPTR